MEDIEYFFGNSALHDYEIGRMIVDYSEGTILFQFISSEHEKIDYTIEQFISICFTKKEEWGKGKYIVSSEAFCNNGIWIIEIQLNSGDICRIMCYR